MNPWHVHINTITIMIKMPICISVYVRTCVYIHVYTYYIDNMKTPEISEIFVSENSIYMQVENTDTRKKNLKLVTRFERLDLGIPFVVNYTLKKSMHQPVVAGGIYAVTIWAISEEYISLAPRVAIYRVPAKSEPCIYVYITL